MQQSGVAQKAPNPSASLRAGFLGKDAENGAPAKCASFCDCSVSSQNPHGMGVFGYPDSSRGVLISGRGSAILTTRCIRCSDYWGKSWNGQLLLLKKFAWTAKSTLTLARSS